MLFYFFSFGVCALLFLSLLILFYAFQPNLPDWKHFQYIFEGKKATVIVGHEVACYGKGFIVSGTSKIDGHDLAKACARSLYIVNEKIRKHRPLKQKSFKAVNHVVFVFAGPNEMKKQQVKAGFKETDIVSGFVIQAKRMFKWAGPGPYMVVTITSKMGSTIQKGNPIIHSLIHAVSHSCDDRWDYAHLQWFDYKYFVDNKPIEKICKDEYIENKD